MSFEIRAGSIYKLPFPFSDLSASKARPALALSDPDENGDVRFAFITTRPGPAEHGLALNSSDFDGPPLPFPSYLHLDKAFLLHRSLAIKPLARLGSQAMASVLRQMILAEAPRYHHFKFGHADFQPGIDLVHYAGRVFGANELVNLLDASLDFYLTANRYAEQFESTFADFLGVSDALLVNSGSSANLVALTALTSPKLGERRLRPSDEVLTVAAGFPTTVAPILQNQLVPVFIDVNLGDYTAIPERMAEAVGPRTRAIMMAHTLGVPFDLDTAARLAAEHGLWLVEDNCDALGARYRGRLTGTFGHLATHSFYPAHHITMGEGGCVATNDELLARIIRSVRDWGRDCYCAGGENNTCGVRFGQQFGTLPFGYDHKYVYSHIGYNMKLTDMQAAIGCAQLGRLENFITRRAANHARLLEILQPYEDRLILPQATQHSEPSWFAFVLTVREDAGFKRADLVRFLEINRIETRNLFSGNLLRHPAFQDIPHRVVGDLANSDRITHNTFFIGVYPGLCEAHLAYVAEVFGRFMAGARV